MKDAEVEFLLSEARKVLDAQWASADRLSSHANTVITVGVSVLTGVLVLAVTSSIAINRWILLGTCFLVLLSVGLAARAYYIQKFSYPPKSFALTGDNRWSAFLNVVQAYGYDVRFLQRRSFYVNASLIIFACAVASILLGIIIHLA